MSAAREAAEELAPLRLNTDFKVQRLELVLEWGPEPSLSAYGELTEYRAEYFLLEFLRDPRELLPHLPASEFRLVPISSLDRDPDVGQPVRLVLEKLRERLAELPRSWNAELPAIPHQQSN